MSELTRKQKDYIILDMLCSLNSTIYDKANMSVNNIASYKKRSFSLPIYEVEMVVSIIEELKPVKKKKKKVKKRVKKK